MVVEAVFGAGFKAINFNPVFVAVGRLGHEVIETQLPIIEVTHHENKFLARCVELQEGACSRRVVNSVLRTCGWPPGDGGIWQHGNAGFIRRGTCIGRSYQGDVVLPGVVGFEIV